MFWFIFIFLCVVSCSFLCVGFYTIFRSSKLTISSDVWHFYLYGPVLHALSKLHGKESVSYDFTRTSKTIVGLIFLTVSIIVGFGAYIVLSSGLLSLQI